MSNKDLHGYMQELERRSPESMIRISKEVNHEYEIPAILQHLEAQKKSPVIVFEKVRNLNGDISRLPVIINLFGSRERLASAIDSTIQDLPQDYLKREKKPVNPVLVDRTSARVKDIVDKGEAVDLYKLPVITHHEMDLGPYFTAGSAWVKDPETGFTNCAIIRILVSGPKQLVVNFNPARHMNHVFLKYKKSGIPMPMLVVNGHHPSFYLGAQTKLLADEPCIIGGVMGEALELTASETWGNEIPVPAQADLVIEAEVSTIEQAIEAPFGEYTQYYGGQKLNPVAEVKAVTMRDDAYYLDIMPGHADHLLLDAPMIEAYLYNRIREIVPGIVGVHVPVSGTARLHAYLQIRKSNDGEPKTAIATALSSDYRIKHVITVDEDVDIYDDEQVLWAVATRSQWDKDMVIIPNMMGARLDPSANGILTAKGGIDATKPFGVPFAKKIAIPDSVLKRIKLEDYL